MSLLFFTQDNKKSC